MFGPARPTMIPAPARRIADNLLRLFYPERCQLCGSNAAGPAEGFVCGECEQSVRWIERPTCGRCGLPFEGQLDQSFECPNCVEGDFSFARARAAIVASGAGRELVHRYKYHRAFWFEPLFERWIRERAVPGFAGRPWSGIVPVPLHPAKRREREFNQATRLGALLGKGLGLSLREDLVRRSDATTTQTRLSRRERAANVRRAFDAVSTADLSGTRWIVVDDVFTTGATTDAVARVLKSRGAEEIEVWTLARGL